MTSVIDKLIRKQYDENLKKIASLDEENKKLREKLEIADKALARIEDFWEANTTVKTYARDALQQIRT